MSFQRQFFQDFFLPACLLALGAFSSQAQSVANFVSMAPCRVIETRDPSFGAFGPPALPANSSRDFAIPTSACGVPANALAYSFNITVIPHGSLPYLTMWPTGQAKPGVSTLNSFGGSVVANAAIVPAGANGSVSVYVAGNTELIVDINGYFVPYVAPVIPTIPTIPTIPFTLAQSSTGIQSTAVGPGASSNAAQNTALGYNSLNSNYNGSSNTAAGANALAANVSGSNNVGIGASALSNNASGSSNTAVGTQALLNNGTASNNTAIGFQTLWSHNGGNCCNTAIGSGAMYSDTGGQYNVAIGDHALSNNLIGANNIAIGTNAGNAVTGYNNIDIGNAGGSDDSNTIRIGTAGQHMKTYIAGVSGIQVSGAAVYVNANGQLGMQVSSGRYKEDIQDMGAASDALMQLRPVQFRYKQAAPDGSKPVQFGLIAEEVAGVYPELVVWDSKGQIESVQYQQLPAMLLNELQKQHEIIARQQQQIQDLTLHLAALEKAGARSK